MNLSSTFANLRKKVAGLTLATLVVSMFATGVATAQSGQIWKDVPADAWFFDYVNNLTEAGVVDSPNTSNDSMYRPGALVTRAEMAKFIVMAAGIPVKKATAAPFKDVPMGQWYTDYVHTLASEGIVSGDMVNGQPTGTFRPAGNVTRAEAAKFMVNGFMFANDTAGGPHFPDVASSAWFYNYVETAYNNQLVAGYPDGMYRPANNINRAEVSKMLDMAMGGATTGFVLEDAAASSSSAVMVTFSMNVDSATAGDKANYMIEDSSGSPLNVSSATVDADKSMVKLMTGTQTSGKTYYVTAKNVKSEAGESLANMDSVSFLGYGSDVSGGALAVALSSQTPVSGSVPSGATGVVFTCWDFSAGSSAAMIKSLHVHRVGPGTPDQFDNIYLYRGDSRLTTGRSISSDTNMVEFNNINQTVAANENAKVCLVADLDSAVSGGVHAFEIASAADVMSNSSNMTGSFPLRGSDQLVTSATVGATTISANGSLDEVTVGQKDARIAQFELEADGAEDQKFNRIALYIRGTVTVSDLVNLKLYSYGSNTPLATVASVGAKDLATFVLATPFKIGKGEKKIFYVTADISPGRDGDTIKSYLDETTDLFVTGTTYGYGTRVNNTNYDGLTDWSEVTIKGSTFNLTKTGPVAGDIVINQKGARCLDLTITNGAGSAVDIKDWSVNLEAMGETAAAGDDTGLYNATGAKNFTLVKLARLNDDGTVAGTLLGSTELATESGTNDATQNLTLGGTASIASGETVKAGIVFDVRNEDLMATTQIRCTLNSVVGGDQVRDENGDSLTASSVTPSGAITGNIFTIIDSTLDFTKNTTIANGTGYPKGMAGATLLAFQAKAGSALDTTIKELTVRAENNTDTNTSSDPKDMIESVGLYDENGVLVSELKSFLVGDPTTVSFKNLNISVVKNATKNLFMKGTISSSLDATDSLTFNLTGTPVVIDQNGQTLSGVSIAAINDNTDPNKSLTVALGTTPTVTGSTTAVNAPKVFAQSESKDIFAFKLKSVNGDSKLQDLTVNVSGSAGEVLPVVEGNIFSVANSSSTCDSGTKLNLTPVGVTATGIDAGFVEFKNLNKTLGDSQDVFLCVKLTSKSVSSNQPESNTLVSVDSVDFNKVQDLSGTTIAVGSVTGPAVDSVFFMGYPTFAIQSLASSNLTSNSEVLKFTAGSVGNVNTFQHFAVSLIGQATGDVTSCTMFRNGTPITDSNSEAALGGDTLVTFAVTDFIGNVATSWQNGATYTVECSFTGLAANDSVTAKLLPVAGAGNATMVWDDGNGATLTPAAFEAVDTVLFYNTVEAAKLTAV